MSKIEVKIGLSTCPNDTYILYPLISKVIDWCCFDFEFVMQDVETLNCMVLASEIDVSKMSVYGYLQTTNYSLLNSGSAIGKANGPLLIAKQEFDINNISNSTIAIPGKNTTAHLLLSIAFPEIHKKQFMFFNQIENSILSNKANAGVIIHETRFSFQKKNLKCFFDFGQFWEDKTGLALPLGCFVIKSSFNQSVIQKINQILSDSVRYAIANPSYSIEFVKKHAQELDIDTIQNHINMYVNDFTVNMGETGQKSINNLKKIALKQKLIIKQ